MGRAAGCLCAGALIVLVGCGPSVASDDAGGSGDAGTTDGGTGPGATGTTSTSSTTIMTTPADATTSIDESTGGICFEVHYGDLHVEGAVEPGAYDCLVEVEGEMWVTGTDLVDLSAFPELERIGGALTITDNQQLESLVGMASLRELRALDVLHNPVLTDVAVLSGDVTLVGNELVPESVYLGFGDNDSLLDLDGLFAISSVTAPWQVRLHVSNNDQLVDVSGIAALASVGPDLLVDIEYNDALTTLGDPWGMPELHMLVLRELPALVDLGALSDLQQVDVLEIAGVHALTSLAGLESLGVVAWELSIGSCFVWDGNDALLSIDLPSLQQTGSLWIMWNDALVSIDGLSNVLVTEDVHVVDNPMLPTADVDAWANMLGMHGAIEICGNAGGLACDGTACPIPE